MVPILQIHTQIPPIRISSLGYQLYQLFKILTYREVQHTGSWCKWRPVGSLTTIHTNIPAITVTLLAIALWKVIGLLYVYAYRSLSGCMIKLLIVLLEQLRSILYQFMVKIKIPENWAEKPPPFCLFVRDPAHVNHVEYPWSPYYKSTLRFLLSEYLL